MTIARDAEMMINARIAQIDHLVSLQLNEVMHNPAFQKLEGTWRGVKYLMDQSETGVQLKIRVMNCSKKELLKDMQRAPEFDQSALFKKVYEEEYGIFGGAVGRWWELLRFRQHPKTWSCWSRFRARRPSTPRSCGGSGPVPHELDHARCAADLAKVFDTANTPNGKAPADGRPRHVALGLPRVLGRLPYGKDTKPVEDFNYEEHVDGSDHSKYLWMNSAFTMATRMTNSFSQYGMCVAMRGVEGGGLVTGLPVHNYYSDEGDVAMKCPTEVPITDRREKLADPLRTPGSLQVTITPLSSYGRARSQLCVPMRPTPMRGCRADSIHHGCSRFAHLPDDARRQQLHVARGRRDFPEPVDHALCHSGRHRIPSNESSLSFEGSAGRRFGSSRKARCVSGSCVPTAALPAGRTDSVAAARGRFAGPGEVVPARLCV
jgi:hypothetical protein